MLLSLEPECVECLAQRLVFFTEVFHFREGQTLQDRLPLETKEKLPVVLLLEEGVVVDDASSVEAFEHEVFAFRLGVDLDAALLQEVDLLGSVTWLLEDLILVVLLRCQGEDHALNDIISKVGKEWDHLDASLDELDLSVVVLHDVAFQHFFNRRHDDQDLLVLCPVELGQRAVLGCNNLGGTLASEDEGDLSEVMAWS